MPKIINAISQCQSCTSVNLIGVIGETCVHFPGLNGLKTEPIFIYPKMLICANCGFTQSNLSDAELEKVKEAAAMVKAASG